MKDLVIHFAKGWEKKYGKQYVVSWGRHIAMLNRLAKATSKAEVEQTVDYYFTSTAPFHVQAGHSLEVFVSAFNGLRAAKVASEKARRAAEVANSDLERIAQARQQKND